MSSRTMLNFTFLSVIWLASTTVPVVVSAQSSIRSGQATGPANAVGPDVVGGEKVDH